MPFKKNEDGSFAQSDSGLPIFVGPDGSEKPYDPDQKATQIAELTEKAAKRKDALDKAQSSLALLGDVEDIGAFVTQAKANAETVASLADKERDTESSVQKRISEAVKAALTPVATERDTLKAELSKTTEGLHLAVIGNAFLNSQYAAEKLKNPALAERLFAGNFAVKDGKPIGRDADGSELYGADGVASFDEALHKLVSASPFKDDLLKPPAGGADTRPGGNNNFSGSGKLSPETASKLSPADYAKARQEGKI